MALAATTGGGVRGSEESAVAALAKIDRLLPPRLRTRVRALGAATVRLDAGPADTVDPGILVTLARACTERVRLRLAYVDRQGRASRRRLLPHRLVSTGQRWYLVGFDLDRDDWRTLRVDRVEAAEATGHRFAPLDLDDAAALVSEATAVAPYRITATVLVDATSAEVRARVPATAGVVEAAGGGRSRLVTGSDSLAALAGHLVWLDLPFEVVDPPELRAHLADVGARLVATHTP